MDLSKYLRLKVDNCKYCAHIIYSYGFEGWVELGKPRCIKCNRKLS